MYVILFSHDKFLLEDGTRDYQFFETEEELIEFLFERGKKIKIDKILESLVELNFGLTPVMGIHAEKKAEGPESVTEADIIRKNKEALAELEAEEEEPVHDLPTEGEKSEEEGEGAEEVQGILDKADKVIGEAKEIFEDRKCSVCGVKTILARNKTGICTPCQLKPKKGKKKPGARKPKF